MLGTAFLASIFEALGVLLLFQSRLVSIFSSALKRRNENNGRRTFRFLD